MKRFLPILEWLPGYRRDWLGSDLVVGGTVWAVLIPSALAYAAIAGVDPVVGLYALPLALAALQSSAARGCWWSARTMPSRCWQRQRPSG